MPGISENDSIEAEARFSVRKAVPADAKKIYALSCEPSVRQNSGKPEPISWPEHVAWFEKILRDANVFFFVYESVPDKRFMGQVRLAGDNGIWTISISVAKDFRGKKLGAKMLREAMAACPGNVFRANVLVSNIASISMFRNLGFTKTDTEVKNGREFEVWLYEK